MANFKVKQHDAADCGPACLSSVCKFYNLHIPLGRIRHLTGTGASGTTLSGLKNAAEQLGFETRAVKADIESLTHLPKPAIVHLKIKDILLHYVVVLKVSHQEITLMDPGIGREIKKRTCEFLKEWTGVILLLVPGQDFKQGDHRYPMIKRFAELARPHLSKIYISLVISLVFTLLGFVIPVLIQQLTDRIVPGRDKEGLFIVGLIATLLVLAQLGLNFYKDLLLSRMGIQIDRHLIIGYYEKLMQLPMSFYTKMKAGEIISRVGDAIKIRSLLCHTAINIIINALVLVFSILVLFSSFWKLGLMVLSLIPIYLVIFLFSNRVYKTTERRIMEYSAYFENQMVQTTSNIQTIKLFETEKFESYKTVGILDKLLKSVYKSTKNQISAQNLTRLVNTLFAVVLLCYGSGLVIAGLISLGELLSFYAITAYFTGPVMELILVIRNIQNALIATDRLFDILDMPASEKKAETFNDIKWNRGLKIKGLRFGYEDHRQVIKGLDANISGAGITAFSGSSGSGKSTLLLLIQGMYQAKEGSISIGNKNLYDYPLINRYPNIAIVPQRIDIFSGSLLENIALGQENADRVKANILLKMVGLEYRFKENGSGLQTNLGENGASLSGGERKKLGLARALFMNPKILLLDEVTSSMDTASEKEIIALIKTLSMGGMTIIITSHKWSTLAIADRILVLEKGKIKMDGTPHQISQSNKFIKGNFGRKDICPNGNLLSNPN